MKHSLADLVEEMDLTVLGRESRAEICDELAKKNRYSAAQVDRMFERLPKLIAIQSLLKFIQRNEESFRQWADSVKGASAS